MERKSDPCRENQWLELETNIIVWPGAVCKSMHPLAYWVNTLKNTKIWQQKIPSTYSSPMFQIYLVVFRDSNSSLSNFDKTKMKEKVPQIYGNTTVFLLTTLETRLKATDNENKCLIMKYETKKG